jgi:hypothetical protein
MYGIDSQGRHLTEEQVAEMLRGPSGSVLHISLEKYFKVPKFFSHWYLNVLIIPSGTEAKE